MFKKAGVTVGQSKKAKRAIEQEFLTAVVLGKTEDVKKCIKKGVDVNVTDQEQSNFTALHLTAEKGDVAMAKILVTQKDIQLNAQNTLGHTPLMTAVTVHKLQFIKLLLRYGANPNIKNHSGKTPLHLAVLKDYAIVIELLAFKASINVVDAFGNTPLSLCIIERPSRSIAKYLLRKGADPNLRTIKAHPLLLELCLNCTTPKHLELAQLLLNFNADPNLTNKISKHTPLHMASITGNVPLAKLLLKRGANPHLRDIMNRSPVDMAMEHEHHDLIAFYKHRKKVSIYDQHEETKKGKHKDSNMSISSLKKPKFVTFTDAPESESNEELYLQHL